LYISQKYYQGDQIKEDEMCDACIMHEGGKCTQQKVGRHEGKRSLGRPRCRWEDSISLKRV
jgi:hypothetical protein